MKRLLLIGIILLAGCAKAACPNFERTDVGSGCRDTRTGEFVNLAHCEEC